MVATITLVQPDTLIKDAVVPQLTTLATPYDTVALGNPPVTPAPNEGKTEAARLAGSRPGQRFTTKGF